MKCPYNCTGKDFGFNDCPDNPGAIPKEGDVGICATCGGWWQILHGETLEYVPTDEELAMTIPRIGDSRRRAAIHAASLGKRLL